MARTFRRQRTAHPIADLNITNLVDLAFVLVAKLPNPKTETDVKFISVGVDANSRFYIENNTAPITLQELQSRLRAFAQEPKQPVIRIRGDGTVPYQKVAELMSEITKAGLLRVTFDSHSEN
jgi:biopolymer transport protein TolR